jgi:hypothetical protein
MQDAVWVAVGGVAQSNPKAGKGQWYDTVSKPPSESVFAGGWYASPTGEPGSSLPTSKTLKRESGTTGSFQ